MKKVFPVIIALLMMGSIFSGCNPGTLGGYTLTVNDITLEAGESEAVTYVISPDDASVEVTISCNEAECGLIINGLEITALQDAPEGQHTFTATAKKQGETIATKEFKVTVTQKSPAGNPRWNKAPEIKNVFFDDFGGELGFSSVNWHLVNYGWGQNGVSAYNAMYTRSPAVVNAENATGGIVVLPSYGHYYEDTSKRGQGTCLISTNSYGPGLYEVRMKVVPRFGPCSAIWPYYTNSVQGVNTEENQEYTEIDIECPAQGRGFYAWGGVTYTKYYQDATTGKIVRSSTGVRAEVDSPYNDGNWHVFGIEWRTDAANGDSYVIWYMDGKEVAFTTQNVPQYTAQLWIGNWFPDNATAWLGEADFDVAYMLVDWVRITEYNDPVNVREPILGGCLTPAAATNLYSAPLPKNNYISNGTFKLSDGQSGALGWQHTSATKSGNSVILQSGGKIQQEISAQYNGYTFDLSVTAAAQGGTVKVYVEYWKYNYSNSNANSSVNSSNRTLVGKSDELIFNSSSPTEKTLRFTLEPFEEGTPINNIRVIIESVGGQGTVTKAEMYLVNNK